MGAWGENAAVGGEGCWAWLSCSPAAGEGQVAFAGGICRAVVPVGRNRQAESVPARGLGKGQLCGMQLGSGCWGAGDLPGSAQDSTRSCPVPPSLPGWVLPSTLRWSTRHPVSLSTPWGAGGCWGCLWLLASSRAPPGLAKATSTSLSRAPEWVTRCGWCGGGGDTFCCHRRAFQQAQVQLFPACHSRESTEGQALGDTRYLLLGFL